MAKRKPSTSAAAAAENVPHKPQALLCHRCGDDIAPDGDREHGVDGCAHPIGVCFEIVKAQRDELRGIIAGSAEPELPKAAKKKAAKK